MSHINYFLFAFAGFIFVPAGIVMSLRGPSINQGFLKMEQDLFKEFLGHHINHQILMKTHLEVNDLQLLLGQSFLESFVCQLAGASTRVQRFLLSLTIKVP